jgi:alpha-1,3-rhamnosyl/mannosyltransferase
MIHDLAPFIFRKMFPDDLGDHYRNRTERAVSNCDALVVNSGTTMNDLLERFPQAAGRTFLTLPGSDHRIQSDGLEAAPPDRPGPGFLLTVGTVEPRKNYCNLVRAYHRLLSRQPGDVPDLVICGGMGYRSEEVVNLVGQLDISRRVTFTGYASEEQLCSLYRNALAYVHPARYEGYGFPVVEALRSGLPVAAADNSAVRELFSGLYLPFEAESPESIAEALLTLLDTARRGEEVAGSGRIAVALRELTWENCAKETLRVFNRVVA